MKIKFASILYCRKSCGRYSDVPNNRLTLIKDAVLQFHPIRKRCTRNKRLTYPGGKLTIKDALRQANRCSVPANLLQTTDALRSQKLQFTCYWNCTECKWHETAISHCVASRDAMNQAGNVKRCTWIKGALDFLWINLKRLGWKRCDSVYFWWIN